MRAIDPSLSYAAALKTEPAERKIEDTNVHRVVRTGWPEKVAVSEIYLPADDLARVVDLAIALGRPLLLQGEPGCGKDPARPFDSLCARFAAGIRDRQIDHAGAGSPLYV